ncbi:hypothetical protein GE21DRAFT_5002 [Neurospora crassa]|uniref:C3H1-type domain-containing protein n=1 Tax=Neurospora crassa (strain ATCC 24698 / 74-OR23-1A / CBS 708.71 / DSM 1257 / FGSC 987) TaxID=367110 RepID=Q7S3M1_NEUCR|nr:hypothetical protein NCU08222 [Neurospora crassa OR74A]EAA30076.2 hypothetical protein NCU08222 [Neurospora crassa OR74A]KHE86470.1 hypothetical protein GE21DRAFT_5002 [Neurospora crassa]|eukprot:XP_959312.2 hypothetical protein NCU08222 [Neurospora crassa OR74A]
MTATSRDPPTSGHDGHDHRNPRFVNGRVGHGHKDHASANGHASSDHQDHPPSNGHILHGYLNHFLHNGYATDGQLASLANGASDVDMSREFLATLDTYNSMHTDMNKGLNLLMDVYRDKNDKLREYDEHHLKMWSKLEEYEKKIRCLEAKNRALNDSPNAFACLIIDGDGALFHDEYIIQGEEGGREAAHELHSALKTFLESTNMEDHIKFIVVKIYLNVEGLSRALMESGIIHEDDKLTKFGRGFCQAQPFFEFIDVGHGKEKADLKATKHFELMVNLKDCKRVMLAGCHDNGYATSLEEYSRWATDKITLVETTPAANGIAKLKQDFDFQQFPDIFRSEPLCSRKRHQQSRSTITSFGTIEPFPSPSSTYATKFNGGPSSAALTKRPSPPPAAAFGFAASNSGDSQSEDNQAPEDKGRQPVLSYAKAAGTQSVGYIKVGRLASSSDVLMGKCRNPQPPKTEKRYFFLNKAQQRVDYPLCRAPDTKVREEVEEKIRKNRANFCNGYHLINRCKHLAENHHGPCDYTHGEPLSKEAKKYLWYKARSVVCKNGSDCREDYCLAGHHCAWGKDCRYKDDCRFKKMHGIDLERFYVVHEGDPCPKPIRRV